MSHNIIDRFGIAKTFMIVGAVDAVLLCLFLLYQGTIKLDAGLPSTELVTTDISLDEASKLNSSANSSGKAAIPKLAMGMLGKIDTSSPINSPRDASLSPRFIHGTTVADTGIDTHMSFNKHQKFTVASKLLLVGLGGSALNLIFKNKSVSDKFGSWFTQEGKDTKKVDVTSSDDDVTTSDGDDDVATSYDDDDYNVISNNTRDKKQW